MWQYLASLYCVVFIKSLVDGANWWFDKLVLESIWSFVDLSYPSIMKYFHQIYTHKPSRALFWLKIGEWDTLAVFLQKFLDELMAIKK